MFVCFEPTVFHSIEQKVKQLKTYPTFLKLPPITIINMQYTYTQHTIISVF